MKDLLLLQNITLTDYFAINILNSLITNAGYQVIDKKKLVRESYELAELMTEFHLEKEERKWVFVDIAVEK